MQIKYTNTNFTNIKSSSKHNKKILDIISKLPSLNIIFDNKLIQETEKKINEFKLNKKKIILFGTGGSNLGARALHNINNKKK